MIRDNFDINEIAGPKMQKIKGYLCESFPKICNFFDSFKSNETSYLNPKAEQRENSRIPGNASVKQLSHFAQLMDAGKFQKYDYGATGNVKRYGTLDPPIYHICNIKKVPVAMFVGLQDELAVPADTRWERDQIKSIVFYKEYDQTDHSSFSMGMQAHTYLDDLINQLKIYNK